MREPVLSKRDMYKRLEAGEFGNRLVSWTSPAEFIYSGHPGPVALRYLEPGAPFCKYSVPREEVLSAVRDFVKRGADPNKIVVTQLSSVDDYLTFQAEVSLEPGGYHVRYSRVKKRMRDALAEKEEYAVGLVAKLLLDRYLEPVPREWLDVLLERYPGHVVELSCYEKAEGNLGWNTIFWEVRRY